MSEYSKNIWENAKYFIYNGIQDKKNVISIELNSIGSELTSINYNINIKEEYDNTYYNQSVLANFGSYYSNLESITIKNMPIISSMRGAFINDRKLKNINNMQIENSADIQYAFSGCSSLENIPECFSNFTRTHFINLSGVFNHCTNLKDLTNSSFWKTLNANIEDLSSFVENCQNLKLNLSNINIPVYQYGTEFNRAFCRGSRDIGSSRDYSNIIAPTGININFSYSNCSRTFWGLNGLKTSKLLTGDYNEYPISSAEGMFAECYNLKDADALCKTNLLPKDMTDMFAECVNLTTINAIPKPNSASGQCQDIILRRTFKDCPNLTKASVLNIYNLFVDCNVPGFIGNITNPVINIFNLHNRLSALVYGVAQNSNWQYMTGFSDTQMNMLTSSQKQLLSNKGFYIPGYNINEYFILARENYNKPQSIQKIYYNTDKNFSNLRKILSSTQYDGIYLSRMPTENITWMKNSNLNMSKLFSSQKNLSEIKILGNAEEYGLNCRIDCSSMFENCYAISQINCSLGYITNAASMFNQCNNLLSVDAVLNLDICTDIDNMFLNTKFNGWGSSMSTLNFNMSSWSSNIINAKRVFENSSYPYNIYDFTIPKVTNAYHLFYNCNSIYSITNNLNLNSLQDSTDMFYNCSKLQYLYIVNLKTNLDLSYSNLSSKSLEFLINNGLIDVNAARTLNLGSKQLSRVNDELKAIATAKNWRLV